MKDSKSKMTNNVSSHKVSTIKVQGMSSIIVASAYKVRTIRLTEWQTRMMNGERHAMKDSLTPIVVWWFIKNMFLHHTLGISPSDAYVYSPRQIKVRRFDPPCESYRQGQI